MSVSLAISHAQDLGLLKPVPSETFGSMLNLNTHGCPKPIPHMSVANRTLMEKRAVLGLWVISSLGASFFQRNDPIRWTPYMETCVKDIDEAKEFQTDEHLLQLVKLFLIINKVTIGASELIIDGGKHNHYYIHAIASQLDGFKANLPPNLQTDVIFQLNILNATISIVSGVCNAYQDTEKANP